MKAGLIRIGSAAMLGGALGLLGASSANTQQSRNPTSCSSSPTTSATATWALRRRRAARRADAAHRPARPRGTAADAVSGRAGCTPSRAALMTGQYSIRNGLSLILVPGSASTLSQDAVTMGEMFKGAGYATAIFGKWHLGSRAAKPADGARLRRVLRHSARHLLGLGDLRRHDRAHALDDAPPDALLAKGPQIVEAVRAAHCARSSRSRRKCAPRSTMNWWPSRSTS